MPILACGHTDRGCRCAPPTPLIPPAPLVADPAELVSMETAPVGPDGEAFVPVLLLPGGLRLHVDASSTDLDAARWWHELGVAALLAAMHYDEHGSRPVR